MKRENDAASEAWNEKIEPFCDLARDHGFVANVAKKLSAKLGRTIHRQAMSRYLHHEKANRVEPLAGTGILLLSAALEATKEMESKHEKDGGAE